LPKNNGFALSRANVKFFGQKPAAKNEEKDIFWDLLNEKNGIHSAQ